jgi:hypothetical protein
VTLEEQDRQTDRQTDAFRGWGGGDPCSRLVIMVAGTPSSLACPTAVLKASWGRHSTWDSEGTVLAFKTGCLVPIWQSCVGSLFHVGCCTRQALR